MRSSAFATFALLLATSGLAAGRSAPDGPGNLAAFAPSAAAVPAAHAFAGRLALPGTQIDGFVVIHDEFGLAAAELSARRQLPRMEFELVTAGGQLRPTWRGVTVSGHPVWEYSVAPGQVWQEPADGELSRAALPFTLHERNANCVHYGILGFRYDAAGLISPVTVQISSETCHYFKFDAWGAFNGEQDPVPPGAAARLARAAAAEQSEPMATRPIAALDAVFPGADHRQFGSPAEVDPADMTVYGLVVNGIHFMGGCESRHGRHPYCEALTLPSYSLAKALFAGLAVMRAAKLHPGIAATRIGEVVAACRDNPAWDGVTIAHALDMATGNYSSAAWMADEDAAILATFFLAEDHATKIAEACVAHPRKAPPGTRWVYHTSDTYLAGTALRAALAGKLGRDVDLYEELVWHPIFARLGLSPVVRSARRTYDATAQPFFGWGLYFQPDDIAKLAVFLGPGRARIQDQAVLDDGMLAAAMQRDPSDRGLPADMEGMRYKSGFRALDVGPQLECSNPAQVIVLAGYGGIILVLFPNDMAYYYFSDGGSHRWLAAAREAHRLRPFCT